VLSKDGQHLPLECFPIPTDDGGSQAVEESPVLILLRDEIGRRNPNFPHSPQVTEELLQIARLLDGLPLSLRLAGGCIATLGCAPVWTRLSDRFALLTGILSTYRLDSGGCSR